MRTFACLVLVIIFLVVPFSTSSARVKVYRCVQENGRVSYQQIACHYGSTPMVLKDRRSGWSPLRQGERALLNDYRKEDELRRRKPSRTKKKVTKESVSCWNKRKQLEALGAKLRRGYNLGEGGVLRRKRNTYKDYLRKFCA